MDSFVAPWRKATTNSSPTPYPGPNSPPTPSFSSSNAFAPPPPPRNPAYMSPRSPGNSSPVVPQNFPSPPPMLGSVDQSSVGDVPQPPPPPPMPTGQSSAPWRSKQAPSQPEQQQQHQTVNPTPIKANQLRVNQGPVNQYDNLPAALQSTLSKDKKPFTYTPGGIDLSELRSPKMQRRLYYNQMDPPRNLAKVAPKETETKSTSAPPPPETYPQPRVQLLPTIQGKMPPPPKHMSNRNQHHKDGARAPSPKTQQQTPRTQAYVHSNYNSPMNLYSPENAADAFNAQTGESLPGFENLHMNTQGTESPRYENEDNFTPYYKGQFPQSRSFRLLQVMTDTTSPNAEEDQEKMMTNREEDEMKFSGFKRNPIPSRAFQTLQKITGDDEETSPAAQYQPVNATRNRTPKKTAVNIQVGNGSASPQYNNSHDYNNQQAQYENQGMNQHSQWIPPSEQPAEAEPKKYMGGHIPSRSFRILQAMTGGDDDAT
uniref:Zasp-like motif domain-containing protein n=1 Tax=Strigamia maritima TaxID=126957 RepID=T1J317_STRMM